MTPAEFARRAAMLEGVPFQLHGRDPAYGLDCVGVIAAALGQPALAPVGYGLRNRTIAAFLPLAERAGLEATSAPLVPGDVLMCQPGPGQHHLLIAVEPDAFIHAHAGLRRVVRQRGPLPWPVQLRWRLSLTD